jgi:hypothetical protein
VYIFWKNIKKNLNNIWLLDSRVLYNYKDIYNITNILNWNAILV